MLDPSDRAALAKTQGGHTTDLLLTGLDIKSLFDTSVEPILEDVANHLQQEKATCNQVRITTCFRTSLIPRHFPEALYVTFARVFACMSNNKAA